MPPPEGRKHRASGVIAGGERELFVPVIWSRRLRANLRKKSWASVSAAVILRLSFHFCYSSFTSRQCFIFVYRSRAAVNLYFNLQEAANPPMGLVASRQMVQSEVGSRAAVLFQGPRSCCISAGVLQCVVDSRVAVPFQGPGSCCTSVGVHQCVGDSVVIALESPGSSLLWVISPGKGGILWSPGQDALLWADARKCPWNWMQKIGLDKSRLSRILNLSGGIWVGKRCHGFIRSIVGEVICQFGCFQFTVAARKKVEFRGHAFDLLPGQQRRA
ncbi:uncharacterized protein LOC120322143 isoform X2 [Drosophila yakuba]|uniref:uncharacterized protein LOC120322143 isoform X2 n=1 Tax=Drosophila yakuba TaxID=7245 RepID=UPI001C8AF44C|nr:uncharacterized protein LOC120322143 isoform X2 [Drosophila yakuba]XP_043063149.1 uncharacterized protein LOC120322143 isoform X2 [Drosophila yakuba]XP_043063150.1 uncharacterized protein LOC120322143 isoform X2 [Drosophila yakuba]XP_043063151.1 uncharacterized protein LOC120322143 isoform X2 [Drosophila yakuba]